MRSQCYEHVLVGMVPEDIKDDVYRSLIVNLPWIITAQFGDLAIEPKTLTYLDEEKAIENAAMFGISPADWRKMHEQDKYRRIYVTFECHPSQFKMRRTLISGLILGSGG